MLKHANAQQAYITASYEDGQVNLIVEDDGKGFSADKLSNDFLQTGLGLRSVKERCDKLQGGCDITSKEGQGTVIHFWFRHNGRHYTEKESALQLPRYCNTDSSAR